MITLSKKANSLLFRFPGIDYFYVRIKYRYLAHDYGNGTDSKIGIYSNGKYDFAVFRCNGNLYLCTKTEYPDILQNMNEFKRTKRL